MEMSLEKDVTELRDKIAHKYDMLNSLWLDVQKQLTSCQIPRPVVHIYHSACSGPEEPMVYTALGLQKIHGKWTLCQTQYEDRFDPHHHDWVPILQCSVQIRLEAAPHVEALYAAVVQSAEDFIPEVDSAIAALSGVLAPF